MNIARILRYRLTRLVYWAMGLNLRELREEIEDLWKMDQDARQIFLNGCLAKRKPLASNKLKVENFDDLKQAPSMTKKDLSSMTLLSQAFPKGTFYRHTAGTTGEPTHIYLNKIELGKMLSVRDYCFRNNNIRLGDREARIWGRPQTNFKSEVKNFLLNRKVFYPIGPEADAEVRRLAKWRPDYVYGYSSLILQLAIRFDYLEIKPPNVMCVICTAETIQESQKNYIARVFGAPVLEEYGSTEFDVIAFECAYGHRHVVNPWLIPECEEGELYITDVSRESQDFVRYQQGDAATLELGSCESLGGRLVIESLGGRDFDVLAVAQNGKEFHQTEFAYVIDNYCQKNNDVLEFKIVQQDIGKFEVLVTSEPQKGLVDLCHYLESELEKRLDAEFSFTGRKCQFLTADRKRTYFQPMD